LSSIASDSRDLDLAGGSGLILREGSGSAVHGQTMKRRWGDPAALFALHEQV